MTLPKAVFFDWDGTLVDSIAFLLMAHNHVRTHFGLPLWTPDDFKKNFKYSSRQLYPKIYPGREQESFDLLAKFMDDNHLQNLKLLDGALELIEFLHQSGIVMGVVSNKRDAFVKREVSHLGWDKYFKVVAGAGYATMDKPDAEPLVKALGEAGLSPGQDVYFVGDTETDLLCAKNAGCIGILLFHDNPNNPLIQQYNPHIAVANCVALKADILAP